MDRPRFFPIAGAGAVAIPAAGAPRQIVMRGTASARLPRLRARLGQQMNGALNESNCKWASRYGLERGRGSWKPRKKHFNVAQEETPASCGR